MITKEQIKVHHNKCEESKKGFGPGEWTNEPNRVEWVHKGMQCLALRQPRLGHWCGYVGIKPGHKYYGIPESSVRDDEGNRMEVPHAYELNHGHGGVTYGRFCSGDVCHIADNDDERLFWLGFDCAHSGDLSPSFANEGEWPDFYTYKTIEYVKRKTNRMAEELLEVV